MDPVDNAIAEFLIRQHPGLVRGIVLRDFRALATSRGIELEELESAGNLGLVEAASRWDPDGAPFPVFAGDWIRKHIWEAIRSQRHTPQASDPGMFDDRQDRGDVAGDGHDDVWDVIRKVSPRAGLVAALRWGIGGGKKHSIEDTVAALRGAGHRINRDKVRELESQVLGVLKLRVGARRTR